MLELRDVVVDYGDVRALWGASLAVEKGAIVALVGANGAGKSTTLKAISRIVPIRSGSIFFEGEPIHTLASHQVVARGVVHVPEGRRLFPKMTVKENLLVGSHVPEARRKRSEALERVFALFPKLKERENQLAGTLSGGEQQMVAIGRGLMAQPKVLMLDEPSLGLAPIIVKEVFAIVRRLRDEGITVLLVEQNTAQSLAIADRGYVMENGRITLSGTGAELLENEHVKKAYLGA
ncbi:MAG: ABC transporter ATP-binding protein [Symbiobacterium sp.]|uniref:ABC transporter ATP-binding protein n=1 Tax=Symbiobacterium sp. TaxID=1971213 RepID=UPI003463F41D